MKEPRTRANQALGTSRFVGYFGTVEKASTCFSVCLFVSSCISVGVCAYVYVRASVWVCVCVPFVYLLACLWRGRGRRGMVANFSCELPSLQL